MSAKPIALASSDSPYVGAAAIPVYVDAGVPPGGGSAQLVVVVNSGPMVGGAPMAVYLAPAGTPAVGPAIPVYLVSGILAATYTQKVLRAAPGHLLGYWPLSEPSGTTIVDESGNGRNGTYTSVTLGATGIGDGRTAATFNGSTSFGNIFTAALASAFTGLEGTIMAWCQVANAGVWTDTVTRQIVELRADANNFVDLIKNSTNNQAMLRFRAAGATIISVNLNSMSTTAWFHIALAWSKTADEVKGYLNGAQVGATQNGVSTFAGSLAATTTIIGAISTAPTQVFNGNLAHVALYDNYLSGALIAQLAQVPV